MRRAEIKDGPSGSRAIIPPSHRRPDLPAPQAPHETAQRPALRGERTPGGPGGPLSPRNHRLAALLAEEDAPPGRRLPSGPAGPARVRAVPQAAGGVHHGPLPRQPPRADRGAAPHRSAADDGRTLSGQLDRPRIRGPLYRPRDPDGPPERASLRRPPDRASDLLERLAALPPTAQRALAGRDPGADPAQRPRAHRALHVPVPLGGPHRQP